MARARYLALVCLLVFCRDVFPADGDVERMQELYRKTGEFERRAAAYEELQQMRRALGVRHLPAASRFEFARQWHLQPHEPGKTGVNGCAWTSAGPTNIAGRVTSIAVDPTDRNRVYATTVGGIWRSADAGRRWQRVSDDFLATVFASIAVNPSSPNEVVAGGGDPNLAQWSTGDGIWRSDDYGAPGSWTRISPPELNPSIVYRLRFAPKEPNDLYVGSSKGVWVGTHNGGTITFTSPLGGFDSHANDIAVDFSATPPRVYATVRYTDIPGPRPPGVYKYDGSQWAEKDDGIDLTNMEISRLSIAQSNPNILYVNITALDSHEKGVWKTTTGAEGPKAWEWLPNSIVLDDLKKMAWFNCMIEVDPTDPERVFASGQRIWLSTTGGTDWDEVSKGKDPDYVYRTHGDTHVIAFDPVNPKIVYLGNDGGLDKSTDMTSATWHWFDSAHGMTTTMFYNMTSNRNFPSLLSGGTQDNGIGITFGNRTWYNPAMCDGYEVGSDAGDVESLYYTCGGGIGELANPVHVEADGAPHIAWNSPDAPPRPVVFADLAVPGAALAAGHDCAMWTILKTTDGLNWKKTNTDFKPGAVAVELASAPSSSFLHYMAAVVYKAPDAEDCPDFSGATFTPFVIRTDNGGLTWNPAMGLPPGGIPTSITFDDNDKLRAYLTYPAGNKVYMTTDGVNFSPIAGVPGSPERVVADPSDENIVYAATDVGVFRGVIALGATPSATWTPFDEGLPDAMDINDLWVDPATKVLSLASFGYGIYRRNIDPSATCTPGMLVVRDNVADDAREPSASGGPDPEHPIADPSRPGGFFKPDDSLGGRLWWWKSRDIRIDVPSSDPKANTIADADHNEFEICPVDYANCPAGAMLDSSPKAAKAARVYVQVTNRGIEPVAKTRVIALWAPASAAWPSLPETFWKDTFPAGGPCGALDPATVWQLVDPVNPCRTIDSVQPDLPELARFDWVPPLTADGGATMLTVIESDSDPIAEWIRQNNEVDLSDLVPMSRHIALRNMKIIPFDVRVREPFLIPIDFPHIPYEPMGDVEAVVSKPDLRESVRFALPYGMEARAGSGSVRRTRIEEPELVRQLDQMRLDPNNAWELSGEEASLILPIRSGDHATLAAIATPADTNASSRFDIVERLGERVVGGVTMLFRPQANER